MEIITIRRIISSVMFILGFIPPLLWFMYFYSRGLQLSVSYAISNGYSGAGQLGFQWGFITTLLWVGATLVSSDVWVRVIFGFFSVILGLFTLVSGFFYAVYRNIN